MTTVKTTKSHSFSHGPDSHRIRRSGFRKSARLRRKAGHAARELVSAEMLAELEAAGDAMRYVNSHGQIAWKATPHLRDYLMDVLRDAKDDLEDL